MAGAAAGQTAGMARGFWTEWPRRGRHDARLLVADKLHALRHEGYASLRARSGELSEVEDVHALGGGTYRRRTTVRRFARASGEELRVTVQVSDGSLRGRLDPLAEEVVLASPDGQLVGDYTLASEGNDSRRSRAR